VEIIDFNEQTDDHASSAEENHEYYNPPPAFSVAGWAAPFPWCDIWSLPFLPALIDNCA
jgi:hypothetical protein